MSGPAPEIPLLTVVPHVLRGKKDEKTFDPQAVLSQNNQPVTHENVHPAADKMFAYLYDVA